MKIDKECSSPIYLQVRDILARKILKGEIKKGQQFPSENFISRKLSINRMTARKAISSLETEGLVHVIPGKGRFVIDDISGNDTPNVAMPPINDTAGIINSSWFYWGNDSTLSGFMSSLTQNFYIRGTMVKFVSPEEIERFISGDLPSLGLEKAAWISANEKEDLPKIKKLISKGIKIVALNRHFHGEGIPFVSIDQYAVTKKTIERMIGAGHEKICYLGGLSNVHNYARERLQGYLDAHAESGIKPDLRMVAEIADPVPGTATAIDKIFQKNKNISAVFAAGEVIQIPAIKYLHSKGYKVPDDISFAAFDEIPIPDRFPAVSYIRQPFEKMAERAVFILEEMDSGKKYDHGEILYPEYIEKGSIRNISKSKVLGKAEVSVS